MARKKKDKEPYRGRDNPRNPHPRCKDCLRPILGRAAPGGVHEDCQLVPIHGKTIRFVCESRLKKGGDLYKKGLVKA
jgi:hypothetical protein